MSELTFLSWRVEKDGRELWYYDPTLWARGTGDADFWFQDACRRALKAGATVVWRFHSQPLKRIVERMIARRMREEREELERRLDESIKKQFAAMDEDAWHTFLSDYYGGDITEVIDSIDICYEGLVQIILGLDAQSRFIIIQRYGLRKTFSEIGRQMDIRASGVRQRLIRTLCSLHRQAVRPLFRSAVTPEWRVLHPHGWVLTKHQDQMGAFGASATRLSACTCTSAPQSSPTRRSKTRHRSHAPLPA